jgi:catechol 2,3-dioxygenase-like lactoylglutathione lyase family enzyme
MAYRFVLTVPEAVHEDAKEAIDASPGADVLISRRSRVINPDHPVGEITVVAHTLDVIDTLYAWAAEVDVLPDVQLDAHKGAQLTLGAYDPGSLRRIIQSDQYWFENTVARISHVDDRAMEGGVRVSEVPYGGRAASSVALVPAPTEVTLGPIDHIALKVRDIARAERFYQTFFGMSVMYRAYREDERWLFLEDDFDWEASIHTGVKPEIVRIENGPVALVLINVGIGYTLHENRVGYVSVNVPQATLNDLRGQALFSSYTVQEDTPHSFRFVDPFGLVWQLVAGDL